jgi:putative ABC transport system substrate-binding protein
MFKGLMVALLAGALLLGSCGKQERQTRIGVVVPIAHRAMDEMVAGFREELAQQMGDEVTVDVLQAYGDPHVLLAGIKGFVRRDYALIVPIGTDSSHTAVLHAGKKPVLGLDVASDRAPISDRFAAVAEASVEPTVELVSALLSGKQQVTLFCSAEDKAYQQAKMAKELLQKKGLQVQLLMIQELSELYGMASHIAEQSAALVILKDHVVASGISVLVDLAKKRGIPLITSDEGTVIDGAAVAVGSKEKEIGRHGAGLAVRILRGEAPSSIGVDPMLDSTLFVNRVAAEEQGIAVQALTQVAQQLNSPIVEVGS